MSGTIAPVPSATAALVADRQSRREHHSRDGADREIEAEAEAAKTQGSGEIIPFHAEVAMTGGGTAFAASQLAERLRLVEANLRLLKIKTEGWKPPASNLSLRDKTI